MGKIHLPKISGNNISHNQNKIKIIKENILDTQNWVFLQV